MTEYRGDGGLHARSADWSRKGHAWVGGERTWDGGSVRVSGDRAREQNVGLEARAVDGVGWLDRSIGWLVWVMDQWFQHPW
jgi:hypothetical protein